MCPPKIENEYDGGGSNTNSTYIEPDVNIYYMYTYIYVYLSLCLCVSMETGLSFDFLGKNVIDVIRNCQYQCVHVYVCAYIRTVLLRRRGAKQIVCGASGVAAR